MLINFYGIRILTDPTLGDRCGVDLGIGTAGPKRYIAPGVAVCRSCRALIWSCFRTLTWTTRICRRSGTFAGKTSIIAAQNTTDLLANAKAKPPTELGWGE